MRKLKLQVQIVDDMEARVRSTWYEVVRGCGVNTVDCRQIAGAFAYPGFRASIARDPNQA